MEFADYKQEIRNRTSVAMENDASSESVAFLRTMINVMTEYGLADEVLVLHS
jgi:hypothetical protein